VLQPRSFNASEVERAAVEQLIGTDPNASVTRRDPDEQGPLVVTANDKNWLVHPDGSSEELT
jgi:hypothetical protein